MADWLASKQNGGDFKFHTGRLWLYWQRYSAQTMHRLVTQQISPVRLNITK